MFQLTYAEMMNEAVQVVLSALIVYMLYGTVFSRYAVLPLMIPLIIDSDHLIAPFIGEAKAFHSLSFISLLVSPLILYALMKPDRKVLLMSATIYVVGVLNISMDLLEGDGLRIMYPFSSGVYVLQGVSDSSFVSLTSLILFCITAAYVVRVYLDLDRTVFTGEPQTGHS